MGEFVIVTSCNFGQIGHNGQIGHANFSSPAYANGKGCGGIKPSVAQIGYKIGTFVPILNLDTMLAQVRLRP
jgi:hypothetical protein